MARVALIGLDGIPPALLFDSWRAELPVINALCHGGAYGPLWSCMPPITVPAWSCMLSSQDPGQLGVYGFRNRPDYSYGELRVATSRDIRAPRVWDLVSQFGGHCIVIGVPGTYPPPAVSGLLIADFLTPSTNSAFTHPRSARERVLDLAPDYQFDVADFRRRDIGSLVADVTQMTIRRFQLARELAVEPWDFFAFHEIGPDRLHHRLFPERPGDLDNADSARLLAYYQVLDQELGLLIETLPAGTAVLVVSDHGARAMHGGVRVNQWLIEHAYLRLRTDIPARAVDAVSPENIDWSRTAAWGEGGYYGRIYFNVENREPQGAIPPDQMASLATELREGLGSIQASDGRSMATSVRTPAELYQSQRGVPPDLMVLFDDLSHRSIGALGSGGILTMDNDTGIDIANHSLDGILIAHDTCVEFPRPDENGTMKPELYDIAPTILDILGLPVPDHMIGGSLLRWSA